MRFSLRFRSFDLSRRLFLPLAFTALSLFQSGSALAQAGGKPTSAPAPVVAAPAPSASAETTPPPPGPMSELAPAAFASPATGWDRIEDQAGWLGESQRDTMIRLLDQYAAVNGVSLYIATAPSGQGPIVLNQARVALDAEFTSAPVAIYVLSSDMKVPMVYQGSDKLKERMGEENFYTMNAAAREAVTKEKTPGKRLAALITTLRTSGLSEVKTKPPEVTAPAADAAAPVAVAAPAEAIPAAPAPTVSTPAPAAAPVPAASSVQAKPPAAPVPAAASAPSHAPASKAPPAPAPVAKAKGESRPYLWVTIACLGALVIVGGGAWFLLNLYRPVEVTPRAADRVQEQKRQQKMVRNRVNGEKVGMGALVNNITSALTQGKTNLPGSESGNRRAAAGSTSGRRAEAAAPKPDGTNARRAPGETFEQRLWRCFGDYSRMHYGRRPESFTPDQVTEAQQHELFAVLDEYLTYFKWLSSQAQGRDDKKAAKLADERYQFLYGASNLLKRSAPTLRNHLMGGLEAFLRECADEGTVPGVTKPRRTAGVS